MASSWPLVLNEFPGKSVGRGVRW